MGIFLLFSVCIIYDSKMMKFALLTLLLFVSVSARSWKTKKVKEHKHLVLDCKDEVISIGMANYGSWKHHCYSTPDIKLSTAVMKTLQWKTLLQGKGGQ